MLLLLYDGMHATYILGEWTHASNAFILSKAKKYFVNHHGALNRIYAGAGMMVT